MEDTKFVTIKYRVLCIAVRPMKSESGYAGRTAKLLIDEQAKRDYIQDEVRAGNFRIETTEVAVEK